MLGSRISDVLRSIDRRRTRLFQGLLAGAALGASVAWFVAGTASASPNPPPMTSPITDPVHTNPSGGSTTPAGGTSPATTPTCTRAELQLNFIDMQGATGHRYIDYALKNVGTSDCTLRGYPRVVLLNNLGRAKHALAAKVGHDAQLSPVSTVEIASGKRAFFTFTWVAGGFCPGNNFVWYGIRIVPPKDVYGFARHRGFTGACGRSVMVSAVRPKLFF